MSNIIDFRTEYMKRNSKVLESSIHDRISGNESLKYRVNDLKKDIVLWLEIQDNIKNGTYKVAL